MKMFKEGLGSLCEQVFEDNKKKGFWDNPRNPGELGMLIIGELAEAQEADRKTRWFSRGHDQSLPFHEHEISYLKPAIEHANFPGWFSEKVKDTVEDEIADAFIRLLDLCGAMEIEPQRWPNLSYHEMDIENFSDRLFDITRDVVNFTEALKEDISDESLVKLASVCLSKIVSFCVTFSINLEWHVHGKIAYNRTRPLRHGKSY